MKIPPKPYTITIKTHRIDQTMLLTFLKFIGQYRPPDTFIDSVTFKAEDE